MAKNFPYFKFVATEWLTGDIVFEDYELQGIFINICALYWHRDGIINVDELTKRLKSDRVLSLKDRFLNVDNKGFISIKFLDEQLVDANHLSKVNSDNGKKGAEAKRNKATAKRPLSDSSANLSKEEQEEEQEEKKRKEKNIEQRKLKFASTLEPFLNKYGKILLNNFYKYWTEPNKSNTKFKQELEKTWSLERRLETWANNEKGFNQHQTLTKVVSKAKDLG